ncbi:MAG: hypothetical protein JWR01_593 [Subtercola sp.]|nr:hypothetical protein [Subtercola sp.]
MSGVTEGKLAQLAAGQWGMLTAAQASTAGVARSTLLRREQSGALDRVRAGVYRNPSAPADPLDEIRAAWLATDPRVPAWERLSNPGVVVGGAAAAWVHDIGDLHPTPYLLYSGVRRQTKHDDVRYSIRRVDASDISVVNGLPVTTRERTLADLIDEPGSDLSIVAGALRDAERSGSDLDTARLIDSLAVPARRLGYAGGSTLYRHLHLLAGEGAADSRDTLVRSHSPEQIDELVDERVEERIRQALAPMLAQLHEDGVVQLSGETNRRVQDAITQILRDEGADRATGVRLKSSEP